MRSATSCVLCPSLVRQEFVGGIGSSGMCVYYGETGSLLFSRARFHPAEQIAANRALFPANFVYIPAGMPHLPYNLSATESCVAVIARTDPNEQESVILLPELDGIHPEIPTARNELGRSV